MAQVYGGHVVRAPKGVMHGKTSLVYHHNTGLMKVRYQAASCMHGVECPIGLAVPLC